MAYGLEVFDALGDSIIRIDGRYTRTYGVFSFSLATLGSTQFIPVPEMVLNDTTFAITHNLAGLLYDFKMGGVLLTNNVIRALGVIDSQSVIGEMTLYRF